MKNLFIIILIISSHSILQAQQISNVRATQNSDNVSIGYDITGAKAGQTFDIDVKCSLNGGNSFTIFPTSISGDIKGVTNGYGKQINWDVLQDRDEIVGENIVFEVTATVKGGETDFSAMQGTFTDSLDNHIYK